MAKQTINEELYGTIRTKLNAMFTELYNSVGAAGTSIGSLQTALTAIGTEIADINLALTALGDYDATVALDLAALEAYDLTVETRLDTLENIGITQVAATTALPAFTATLTPTKLTFFNLIALQDGTMSTANVVTQDVTINTAGVYRISGNIILEFPQTDQVAVQLYKNGIAATPSFHQQGLGAGKPVNIGYTTLISLIPTDVLTIYVTSLTAPFSCTVDGSSVLIEKTTY